MSNQTWNANQYINHASFVSQFGNSVVDILNPSPGETILDLGCGDGILTMKIKEAGAKVHGVDYIESMISAAKARGLSAQVGNGEKLNFYNQFDAVFSNAALHY